MIPESIKHLILPSHVSPKAINFEQEYLKLINPDVKDLYLRMRKNLNLLAQDRNGICYPIIAEADKDKFLDYGIREPYYYPLRKSIHTLRKMKLKGLIQSVYQDMLSSAMLPFQTTRQASYHIEILRAWITSSKKEDGAKICWNLAAKKNKFNRERLKENFQNIFGGNSFKISVAIWDYDHFKDRWNFDLPKKK